MPGRHPQRGRSPALPRDLWRLIFAHAFAPPPCNDKTGYARVPPLPPGLPLRDAVDLWFSLLLTCRAWANALPGLPLPRLEVWAASEPCLAWLGSANGPAVSGLSFIRRAPLRIGLPANAAAADADRGTGSGSSDDDEPLVHGPRTRGAVAAAASAARAPFRRSQPRVSWRRQRSIGVPLFEWPTSPYDEMMFGFKGILRVQCACGVAPADGRRRCMLSSADRPPLTSPPVSPAVRLQHAASV